MRAHPKVPLKGPDENPMAPLKGPDNSKRSPQGAG
jgi:hypothetical protein